MNIFVLDNNPIIAAQQQCDKHVVKMSLETAQLLCTALRLNGIHEGSQALFELWRIEIDADLRLLYRPTHVNHPCAKWAATSRENFMWLCEHGLALCQEYTARYNKIHKCQRVIETARKLAPLMPAGKLTPFVLAMPDAYKTNNAVDSYRKYYMGEKFRIAEWKRNKPVWFTNEFCNETGKYLDANKIRIANRLEYERQEALEQKALEEVRESLKDLLYP